MGDGNPGEQGAGEGGRGREAGTEIKKAFFFFFFFFFISFHLG